MASEMKCISFFALFMFLLVSYSTQSPPKLIEERRQKEPSYLQRHYLKSASNRVAVCGYGNCTGTLQGQFVITTAECVKYLPVVVYHLHSEEFDCSNGSDIDDSEKRVVEKIFLDTFSSKQSNSDIVILRLETPYDSINLVNFTQDNVEFEPWSIENIERLSEKPVRVEAAVDSRNHAKRNFASPIVKKTSPFKVFATIVLLPFFTFAVIYFVISFFSRSPPQVGCIGNGYYMFGKGNGYDDTNV